MWYNNRKLRLSLLFFLLMPLLTGCWDAQEIEQRATVLALGIDAADDRDEDQETEGGIAHPKGKISIPDKDMIRLTAQIAVPGRIPLGPAQGAAGGKPVLIIQVVG